MGRKPASLLLHIALDRWSKRMLRADNTSVIVAYFDPPGIHKESLLRQPSDLSIASTLKATSDGEEEDNDDDDDAEMDEIFPSSCPDDEESHQATGALFDRRKPALKRMSPSPANLLKHNRSSPSPFAKAKKGTPTKMDAENDPNKVSVVSIKSTGRWSGQKRPATDDDIIPIPLKRACLASPESSRVSDSPMVGSSSSNSRQPLHCSIPLQVELSPAAPSTSSSSSGSSDNCLISPLWPSHLADDLLSDNAMSEPVVTTVIKPLCGGASSKSKDDSAIRSNGPSPSPLSSQNKPTTSVSSQERSVPKPLSRRGGRSASACAKARLSPNKTRLHVNRLRTVKNAKASS